MQPEDETSSLERLREKLYRNQAPVAQTDRTLHESAKAEVPHAWASGMTAPPPTRHGRSFTTVFFLGALVFFVVAIVVASFLLFSGGRSISTDHVNITVQGPTTISGGDTVPLSLIIENQNPSALQGATITVNFPDGTRSADNVLLPLTRYTDTLGDIPAGGRVERSAKAIIFGTQDQAISIPVTLQYHTVGSSAVFVKTVNYQFTVSTAPLSVTVDATPQVVSGQPVSLTVSVRSNATTPLANVALSAGYPFGFTVSSTSIPVSGASTYKLGTLKPGDHTDVRIRGSLSGQDGEEKVFHFTVGTLTSATSTDLGIAYTAQQTTVNITKPFLAVSLTLDQSASEPSVIGAGKPVTATLKWANTLSTSIQNGEIDVALSGSALDQNSITTQNGFYRSSDTTIVFDRDTDPALGSISPGETGTETFMFASRPDAAISGLHNPVITFAISMSGRSLDDNQIAQTVTASAVRTAKVASDIALTSTAVRTTGPFANSGPWPPVAGSVSTYTIQLGMRNTVNSIANGSMAFTLPSYVDYKGAVSPSDGSLAYNNVTRTFTWNLGDIAPNASRQTSFQVSLTPSTSQSGTSPALISAQTFSGFDRFVMQSISATLPPVTIQTVTDPSYQIQDGQVQ